MKPTYKLLIAALLAQIFTLSAASAEGVPAPAFAGPLAPHPVKVNAGPAGDILVGGVLSGLAYTQSNRTASDDSSRLDLSNAQVFVQKVDGLVQFFVQAGNYSMPALGSAYIHSPETTDSFYGIIPVAYLKLAPTDNFSVQVGKLPTLIGAEYTFTFQNMNIARGLLWNQENAVNDGIQANYTDGPLSASVALNDGFYSDDYSWLTGLVSYQLDSNNTLAVVAGGNLGDTSRNTLATPVVQDNSEIYNIMYTYTNGPWTVAPYLQYTHAAADPAIGIADDAETRGAAVLAKYQFNEEFSIAGRVEYIDSSGGTSVLYGPDSSAYSFTVTPTYQKDVFFIRGEASYVGVSDSTAGSAFGTAGNDESQFRGMMEVGVIF